MWWQPTAITLSDSILFSIVSIVILYLIGLGATKLIFAIAKKPDPFNQFDFFQRFNFRILLGFVFIILIVFILSIFNLAFLIPTLLIIAITVIGFVVSYNNYKFKLPKQFSLKKYSTHLIILLILIIAIILLSLSITGFYGSTNEDEAFHTLVTTVILNNPNALITRSAQPYANFDLYYPSGTYVLCAFFVTLLNVPIQKILIMFGAILPVLIALSFYSTIKCLFKNPALAIMGLTISALLMVNPFWIPVASGEIPSLLSLYVSISSIGLMYVFSKNKTSWLHAFLIGLLFFIAVETYPDAIFVGIFWLIILLIENLYLKLQTKTKLTTTSILNKQNLYKVCAFIIPFAFSFPYLYYIFENDITNYIQINNLTIYAQSVKSGLNFSWLLNPSAVSQVYSAFSILLILTPVAIILGILLLIPQISRKVPQLPQSYLQFKQGFYLMFVFLVLLYGYLLLALYFPINFLPALFFPVIFNAQRLLVYALIPAIILTSIVILFALYFTRSAFKRLLNNGSNLKRKTMAWMLLAVLLACVGLLCVSFASDQQTQYAAMTNEFNTRQALKQDDLSLMQWMTKNTPPQANILVSAGDSGQYVTSITHRPTISMWSNLANYSNLMTLLTNNASDVNAIPLMIQYNVTYVYIGSTPTTYLLSNPEYRAFNATQFQATPYFILTKQIGNAYLFQFNATQTSTEYR
jgi:hypothetical protein